VLAPPAPTVPPALLVPPAPLAPPELLVPPEPVVPPAPLAPPVPRGVVLAGVVAPPVPGATLCTHLCAWQVNPWPQAPLAVQAQSFVPGVHSPPPSEQAAPKPSSKMVNTAVTDFSTIDMSDSIRNCGKPWYPAQGTLGKRYLAPLPSPAIPVQATRSLPPDLELPMSPSSPAPAPRGFAAPVAARPSPGRDGKLGEAKDYVS
jgi:hypothetical protein